MVVVRPKLESDILPLHVELDAASRKGDRVPRLGRKGSRLGSGVSSDILKGCSLFVPLDVTDGVVRSKGGMEGDNVMDILRAVYLVDG